MTTDKSKTLTTSIKLLNEKLHFEGKVHGNEPISIDYTPPLGDNMGYTSLELFLLSLSSCAGSAILVLLRKMNKQIEKLEITSVGERKVNHPTGFETITLLVKIESYNILLTDLEKVLERLEVICPVLSMLDKGVKTTIKFRLNE
ncbi:MAG: OsmC family protein [Bacteroidales bacterium]